MYVLVLGLDVLGNPFGLIRGLSEGVEALFYEPFQVLAETNVLLSSDKYLYFNCIQQWTIAQIIIKKISFLFKVL